MDIFEPEAIDGFFGGNPFVRVGVEHLFEEFEARFGHFGEI